MPNTYNKIKSHTPIFITSSRCLLILHPLMIRLIDPSCHECLLAPSTTGHTYSPHVGINLSWPQSATPSGVPQYQPKSVFVPRLQNSSATTEEGNLLEPIRMSHDLTHSTGLLKPPGYNLEWPRIP